MNDKVIVELDRNELLPFIPLLAEIECGNHFCSDNQEHLDWLNGKIDSRIACGTRFYGLFSKDNEIMGVVGVQIEQKLFCSGSAEVVDIGVVDSHRRKGLGSKLLSYAIEKATEAGAHAVFARTYAADTETIAFYGRNLFYPVAIIPDTNGPNDEGDIVMRRLLNRKS